MLSTITVTTAADNGSNTAPTAGSLRAAIIQANAQPAGSLTTIDFKIGTGPQTISPTDALPQITRPVVIDGTTQPGYAGKPIIDINGTSAGSTAVGFAVATTASGTATAPGALKGLEITGFGGGGVSVQASHFNLNADYIGLDWNGYGYIGMANGVFGIQFSGGASDDSVASSTIAATKGNGVVIAGAGTSANTLTGDFIGTDPTGDYSTGANSMSLGNTGIGVEIDGGATSNSISTSVISNNGQDGVCISGAGTQSNSLAGDFIGTNATGIYPLPNGADGVSITSSASSNTVGGTAVAARDIISFNTGDGVAFSSGASDNQVLGDYIGTSASGTSSLGNDGNGVSFSGSSNDTVGGTTAGARDVISGNESNGVWITGGSTGIVVEGDDIGTDVTGEERLGNTVGVRIDGGSKSNTIGGTAAGACDVISGNAEFGVVLSGSGTSSNVVEGDHIGTNSAGTGALANDINGLDIISGATSNTVGGTTAGARDVISGNMYGGVVLADSGTSHNVVEGDYIGTDVTGAKALANGQDGVLIDASASFNTVGGTTAGARDVVSGNAVVGVYISDAGTSSNLVEGDFIGTNAAGTGALPNAINGLDIVSGATFNTVGGTTAGDCDVISGNTFNGVVLADSGTDYNVVEGDDIGTDVTGTKALANGQDGVQIVGGATSNTVGGTTAGTRDVISGNAILGVFVLGTGTQSNVVEGDYIGTSAAGTGAVPNRVNGLDIASGASFNTVGGTTAGARDVISGNALDGVEMESSGTENNVVEGDYIGTDVTGTKALANGQDGVEIDSGASCNTVGGTTAGARDVISGNAVVGVYITGSGTESNVVEGDYLGTSAAGTGAVPNAINGLDIVSGATSNTVGGTTAGARDVISGNTFNGVVLAFAGTDYNLVVGDYIGTDVTGGKALANSQDGVDIIGGATSNIVGGSTTGARDVISGNADNGVLITDPGTTFNFIEGNYIGTDATGTFAVPNTEGVLIQNTASSNLVGGSQASARNVISGNSQCGVLVTGSGTIGNTIRYDFIGTDVTGEHPVSNGFDGVILQNGVSNTYVDNNVISANANDGVLVTSTSTNTNFIEYNSIGLDATGLKAVKQTGELHSNVTGVAIDGSTSTSVEYNFVSGNVTGIYVGAGATSNSITDDDIGTGVDGMTNVGNLGDGVILDNVSNNVIAYDVLVYNGNVGVLGENGTTETSDQLLYDTFTLIVNGLAYSNKNGATMFD